MTRVIKIKSIIKKRLEKEDVLDMVKLIGSISDDNDENTFLVGDVVKNILYGKGKIKELTFASSNPKKVMNLIANEMEKETKERPKIFTVDPYTKKMIVSDKVIEISNPIKETWSLSSLEPKLEKGNFLDDAIRRDFTIDALVLGIQEDNFMEVIDYTGKGISDLERKILRTPLDADEKFRNNPIQMIEMARLSACDGFNISESAMEATKKRVNHIHRLSEDVIREEMNKAISCNKYIPTLNKLNLLEEILPEIADMKKLRSGTGIIEFNHTIQVGKGLPKERIIRWVGLLHDLGIITREEKHTKEGKKIALTVLDRLKFPKEERCHIAELVGRHKALQPYIGTRVSDDEVRGFILDNEPFLDDIFTFAVADKWGHWQRKKQGKKVKKIESFKKRVNRTISEMCEDNILSSTSKLCGNKENSKDFSYCKFLK